MEDQNKNHKYSSTGFSLNEDVPPPSYSSVLDWMKIAEGKSVAFDIWARGNYARRVITNRIHERNPVLVPFRYVDEMRWAYRRLALMGLPAEFVYIGDLGKPKHILTLHPGGDYLIDSGWGYLAALGSVLKKRGREWFPVTGYARLMPESILEWLTSEAANAFLKGDVFVSPAELVGIGRNGFIEGTSMMGEIQNGTVAMEESKATEAIASLELPQLDNMSASKFEILLNKHTDDLVRFRNAMRKLAKGEGSSVNEIVEEIRSEVAEMSCSDKYLQFRRSVTKFGGVFTTFSAAVGVASSTFAANTNIESLAPAVGAATAAGAASVLVELWKQEAERKAKIKENKLSLLWELGLHKAKKVRRNKLNLKFLKYNCISSAESTAEYDCHWLCPPTNGLGFLAVKK